jgi:hypothetical protein
MGTTTSTTGAAKVLVVKKVIPGMGKIHMIGEMLKAKTQHQATQIHSPPQEPVQGWNKEACRAQLPTTRASMYVSLLSQTQLAYTSVSLA